MVPVRIDPPTTQPKAVPAVDVQRTLAEHLTEVSGSTDSFDPWWVAEEVMDCIRDSGWVIVPRKADQ